MVQNIDLAFEHRFLYKVTLSNPGKEARSRLWKNMVPHISDDAVTYFADSFNFSGSQIENTACKTIANIILFGGTPTLEDLKEMCLKETFSKNIRTNVGYMK